MIDDLTTTEHREPYRLHTSRAEYRLLLRQDTAHFRLTPIGYRLGLIGREVYERTERQRDQVATMLRQVRGKGLGAAPELNARLCAAGLPPVTKSTMALAYLRRPEVGAVALAALGWDDVPDEVADHVLTEIKYEGFIARQAQAVARSRQLEHHRIPRPRGLSGAAGATHGSAGKAQSFSPGHGRPGGADCRCDARRHLGAARASTRCVVVGGGQHRFT